MRLLNTKGKRVLEMDGITLVVSLSPDGYLEEVGNLVVTDHALACDALVKLIRAKKGFSMGCRVAPAPCGICDGEEK